MSNPDDQRNREPEDTGNVIPFPDRRRGVGVEDALVPPATGRIKPPTADHELEFHDVDSIRAFEANLLRTVTLRSVAESIIMGELTGDIGAVDDSYQDDVLAMITSILTGLSDERDLFESIFHTLNDETILDALGLTDEELMEISHKETGDSEWLEAMLAGLILKVREKINRKSTRISRLRTGIRALKPIRLLK